MTFLAAERHHRAEQSHSHNRTLRLNQALALPVCSTQQG